ncbi:hypothetical protein HNQ07_004363 [Deinococcus metalli]|uniref:DUF4382 domain-containing protein n=1 Tax=Deinococcus metalli TaxID=1141878 RepID=A0A7W8KKV3_9DEIO|nr:hypothetical protein [Deinococcus metalli]MBB5378856.1 hypothetical protein [Deinococcus metalli]GHF62205.1 hypothetical protein GCM10017781_42860 [Deinococcus metalli]
MTHRSAFLLTLTFALAACSQAPQAPHAAATPAASSLTAVTLSVPLRGALTRQGLPTADSGASLVDTLKVKIKDASGTPVTFDGQNVYQAGGAQDSILLTKASSSVQVLLPVGTYTFETAGTASTGEFLAYGLSAPQAVTRDSQSVDLALHTLLDPSAVKVAFAASSIQPGDALDARVTVLTHDLGGVRVNVPTGDYSVSYRAEGGSVVAQSKLGARVQNATAAPGGLGVVADVQGWVATGPDTAALDTVTVGDSVPVATTLTAGLYEENDPAIQYTGAWTRNDNHPPSHGGTDEYTSTSGDSVLFAFQGTGLSVYVNRYPGAGVYAIYLDGEYVTDFNAYNSVEAAQSEMYRLDTLDPAVSHTVKLVCVSPNCVLDYVEVR